MFLEILLAIALGVASGIFTGLIPGIHINLISSLITNNLLFLETHTTTLSLALIILGMSLTHTFLDTIPSIFLGAPEAGTELSVLPGHRYLLEGKGVEAVIITGMGSLGGLLISILFFPFAIFFLQGIEPILSAIVPYLILLALGFMIFREQEKGKAFLIVVLSSTFGLLVLLPARFDQPLFPLLTGLFGISSLLLSLSETTGFPKQSLTFEKINYKELTLGLLAGSCCGFFTAITPALGSGMAAVIALTFLRNPTPRLFLLVVGCISTVNFFLSLATYYVLEKARNGSIIALQELLGKTIQFELVLLFVLVSLVVGGIAFLLCILLSSLGSRFLSFISYKKLVLCIISFLCCICVLLSGLSGLFLLIIATSLGVCCAQAGVSRTLCMSVLMVPTLVYLFF